MIVVSTNNDVKAVLCQAQRCNDAVDTHTGLHERQRDGWSRLAAEKLEALGRESVTVCGAELVGIRIGAWGAHTRSAPPPPLNF